MSLCVIGHRKNEENEESPAELLDNRLCLKYAIALGVSIALAVDISIYTMGMEAQNWDMDGACASHLPPQSVEWSVVRWIGFSALPFVYKLEEIFCHF